MLRAEHFQQAKFRHCFDVLIAQMRRLELSMLLGVITSAPLDYRINPSNGLVEGNKTLFYVSFFHQITKFLPKIFENEDSNRPMNQKYVHSCTSD